MTERWAAIDFETATREPNSACALGVALVEDDRIVETLSWLIRPPFNEYEFWNTNVHGISAEDTEFAPEFDEVWWEVRQVLEGTRLLAHNAPFDMRVLRALFESREIDAPHYEYACTLAIARKVLPELPRHTLDVVCDHCGIRLVHHDAASDAEGCARIAVDCIERTQTDSISSALEQLGVPLRGLLP
ncbi:MAG: 3'-5' exonuclease [Coriobacteriia bacterium]|nr:3'-5' exonuclease [Coriobacteriia bacterium]